MEKGNVPACLGEPRNSSEEKLRLLYWYGEVGRGSEEEC